MWQDLGLRFSCKDLTLIINAQYLWNYGCVNLNIVIYVNILQ